jgi:multiple antibiotic resistance protein
MIATIIVLYSNHSYFLPAFTTYFLLTIAILLAVVIVYFTLLYASVIYKTIGITGMKILTRIMGLIV